MATRTTTTRTTAIERVPSEHQRNISHADFSFYDLVSAYFDCRRNKRNKPTALAFELNLERNLLQLYDELQAGTYRPGPSICFVITRPKPREVWAADFRDRVVHHLLYNKIAPRFYAAFIADSCACIPGRGTLYAAHRLDAKVRSITQNWKRPAHYLKCDLANFFVSIHKPTVRDILAVRVIEPWWLQLAELVLFHDPRPGVVLHSPAERMALIPPYKRLSNQSSEHGLPIGNISSQFFANVYMNVLDQHVKHRIGARHYIRYVDDFVLLHESPQWLNAAKTSIEILLREKLSLRLNHAKTILQPIDRGIDFVGHLIKPWRRILRRRTVNDAMYRMEHSPAGDVFASANSYFGLLRQATRSRNDRIRLAEIVNRMGYTVDRSFTKVHL